MSDTQIHLYTDQGVETLFCLRITANQKYYLTKTVACPESYYSDKTTYRSIVIQPVEDPFNIVFNDTRLFISTANLEIISRK